MDPSAENPPMVEQGPPLDIPPAAGAAPAMAKATRWEITLLTECTEAEAEAALEPLLNALDDLDPPLGAIIGVAPYTDKFEYVGAQDSPDGPAPGFAYAVGTGDQEPGTAATAPAPTTYRLWVNMKGTILVRMWDGGAVEVARRDATWETWGPPETLFEEKT